MVGWRQLNRHELEQTSEGGEGQGSLACCSPWGREESDMTGAEKQQQQNNLEIELCVLCV